jgi:hypothetical protein
MGLKPSDSKSLILYSPRQDEEDIRKPQGSSQRNETDKIRLVDLDFEEEERDRDGVKILA